MSTTTIVCDLCEHRQQIRSYEGFKCAACGQPFVYDNDCYRLDLSKEQLALLRRPPPTAALRAASTAQAGWVIVPLEPTPEMLRADIQHTGTSTAYRIYRAMLAASPAVQSPPEAPSPP
jgi:hypothetical protein